MANKKEVYLVEGMSCSGCERAIQRIVGGIEGVDSAQANFSESTVAVQYDTQKVTVDQIKEAVSKIGYRIVGERPPLGQREGRDDAVS